MIIHVEDPARCVPPFCEKDIDRKMITLYLKSCNSVYIGYATKEHNYAWYGMKLYNNQQYVHVWHPNKAKLLNLIDTVYKTYVYQSAMMPGESWICDIAILETQSDFREFLAYHEIDISNILLPIVDRAGRLPP